jgi:hypothetical protein
MLNFNLAPALAFDRKPSGLEIITVTLAFDREPDGDNKRTDSFDRLHAKRAPITKACVSPYYGREIPKGEELGLEPNRVYKLLRDPEEIRKGAATSHNIPLLSKHVPHSADDHDGNITVGTVGSDSEYEHPILYNSLAVWSREGIDHVEQGTQKELSSAYSYDADMTPGTYEGEPYDGVMRNMVFNHVCLVKKGRVGSDVALDEALQPNLEEILSMTKLKSLKASVAYGALSAFLKPKLAMDAQINLAGALATFEPKKFKASIPTFIAALKKSLVGKLAQDGDLAGIVEGVEKLMASIDGDSTVADGPIADVDPGDVDGVAQGGENDEDDTSMDSGLEAVKAYLKSKGVPDDIIAGIPGEEEPEIPAADAEAGAAAALAAGKGKDKPDFVSKGAMDAALKVTAETVRKDTIAAMNAVAAARDHVRPIVGEIALAFDSAEGVYRQAFKMHGTDVSKVKDPAALQTMWDLVGTKQQTRQPIAQDAAAESAGDFAKQFPHMAKVKRA